MGSGATAVEAGLQYMYPVGVEVDPFARLISNVRVAAFNSEKLQRLEKIYQKIKKELGEL